MALLVQNAVGLYNDWLGGGLATATSLHSGNLDCDGRLEPLWLLAQSVPSASMVPCLRTLATGWTFGNLVVNNGRSRLTLDHDRAGSGAVQARLTAACDPANAVEVTSGRPDVSDPRSRTMPRPACLTERASSIAQDTVSVIAISAPHGCPARSRSRGTTSSPVAA